jgi:hypothetical protein
MAVTYPDANKKQYGLYLLHLCLNDGSRQVWFSLTFKNDVKIIEKAITMHDELVADRTLLWPFQIWCAFQPLPTLFTQHSAERGGNLLGLDRVKENALLWLITGSTDQ